MTDDSGLRACLLEDRGVVGVFGPDAPSLLQGVVTCNVESLVEGAASLGALLTPQGKILFEFLLLHNDENGFFLDVTRALAPDLVKRLNFYRLRAKVEINDLSDRLVVGALWGAPASLDDGVIYDDPRFTALGQRAILPRLDGEAILTRAGATLVSSDLYHQRRIEAGIPEGGKDYTLGDTFPHEANMDTLKGVDFAKGCYVGQEVVSRMQHRATTRKRIIQLAFDDVRPLEGAEIRAGDVLLGYMGTAVPGCGLAMLRLDKVDNALHQGIALMAGGLVLRPVTSVWANFNVPGTTT